MMQAAVLCAPGRIELRDVPQPVTAAHEVLVRITAVGLCGTDRHIYSGETNYHRDAFGRSISLSEAPQILGHEIAGVVETIGADVRGLRVGDRVVIDQGRNCVSERRTPRCEYCASDASHQCESYREHGITGLPGGFAEFIAVPGTNAMPTTLDSEAAALVEPLACVTHAMDALGRAQARYSIGESNGNAVRSILICGAGPAGLLFVQYLRRVLGFDGTLLVSDPSPVKRQLASDFGADALEPDARLSEDVRGRTGGRRVELLIEASGSGRVFPIIPEVIRKQATVVLYGHGHGGTDLSVLNSLQFMEPTLVAPTGASGGFDADGRPSTYLRALQLVDSGLVNVRPLISHRWRSLDAVPDAFRVDDRAPDYVKSVVLLES